MGIYTTLHKMTIYMNNYRFIYQCSDTMKRCLMRYAKCNRLHFTDGYMLWDNMLEDIYVLKRQFPKLSISVINVPIMCLESRILSSIKYTRGREITITFR